MDFNLGNTASDITNIETSKKCIHTLRHVFTNIQHIRQKMKVKELFLCFEVMIKSDYSSNIGFIYDIKIKIENKEKDCINSYSLYRFLENNYLKYTNQQNNISQENINLLIEWIKITGSEREHKVPTIKINKDTSLSDVLGMFIPKSIFVEIFKENLEKQLTNKQDKNSSDKKNKL